ncbi:MAG: hypothetical protein WAV41_02100 [Microgenomates group bacterium]
MNWSGQETDLEIAGADADKGSMKTEDGKLGGWSEAVRLAERFAIRVSSQSGAEVDEILRRSANLSVQMNFALKVDEGEVAREMELIKKKYHL